MVLVRPSTRRSRPSVSRSQPPATARPSGRGPRGRRSRGTGAPRSRRRSSGQLGVVAGRRRAGPAAAAAPASAPASALRSGARPGRAATAGCAALNVLRHPAPGSSGSTGVGKSTSDSRRTWRSAVSTVGRGPVRAAGQPGSRTTAQPARRPAGTRMTSPRRSRSSEAERASPRRSRERRPGQLGLAVARSAGAAPAYSAKSPRWQRHRLGVARPGPPRCRRTCRASPTTARSAWNWANEVSRISRAARRGRPGRPG